MSRLRWGILGTGNIAKQFAEGVRTGSDRTALVATGSRTQAAADGFAAKFGGRAHGSYDALLADAEVDAIYLSLPNAMHHEWTLKALAAGKHVLCEKPLACSTREAQEMFAAARAADRVLIEAFMYRAHPQTRAIADTIARGAIGTVKNIRTSFCYRVRNWQGNIRFDPTLQGGALMDVGCYCISFSRLIAGTDPDVVHAVARRHESGVDEQTTVAMRYPNGITAEFTVGMMTQADNTAHVCGDEGYLSVGWPWKPAAPGTQILVRGAIPPRQDAANQPAGNAAQPPVAPPPQIIDVPNSKPLYALEADAFAATVLDGVPPFMTEAESIGVMRTIEQIAAQTA